MRGTAVGAHRRPLVLSVLLAVLLTSCSGGASVHWPANVRIDDARGCAWVEPVADLRDPAQLRGLGRGDGRLRYSVIWPDDVEVDLDERVLRGAEAQPILDGGLVEIRGTDLSTTGAEARCGGEGPIRITDVRLAEVTMTG